MGRFFNRGQQSGGCSSGSCGSGGNEVQQPVYSQPYGQPYGQPYAPSSCGMPSDGRIQSACGAPVDATRFQQSACGDAWGPRGGKTVSVDGQSQATYDAMISSKFPFTQDNYKDALAQAGREGRPLVAVYGSWEHNNSRGFAEKALDAAKRGAGREAIYVHIDPTKCKDPELLKAATEATSGGHNATMTVVYSVKPGADGKATAEKTGFQWQGDHLSMIPSFNDAVYNAKLASQKVADQPANPVGPQPEAGDGKPVAPPKVAPKEKEAPVGPPGAAFEPKKPDGLPVAPEPKAKDTPPPKAAEPGKGSDGTPPPVPGKGSDATPPPLGVPSGLPTIKIEPSKEQQAIDKLKKDREARLNDPAQAALDDAAAAKSKADLDKVNPAATTTGTPKSDNEWVLPSVVIGGIGAAVAGRMIYNRLKGKGGPEAPVPAEGPKPGEEEKKPGQEEAKKEEGKQEEGKKEEGKKEEGKKEEGKKEGEVTAPPLDEAAAAKAAAADKLAKQLSDEMAKVADSGVPDLHQATDFKGTKLTVAGYGGGAVIMRKDIGDEPKDGRNMTKLDPEKFTEVFVEGESGRTFRHNNSGAVYRERQLDRTLEGGSTGETKLVVANDLTSSKPNQKPYKQLQAEALAAKAGGSTETVVTAPEKADKALATPEAAADFHKMVTDLHAQLKANPGDASARMTKAMSEFMTQKGVDKALLSTDRMSVAFDESLKGTEPKVEFTVDGGKVAVSRNNAGEFVDANLKVHPSEEVSTKITVPSELLDAKPHELSRALYAAALEQTSKGEATAQEKANMGEFASKALAKQAAEVAPVAVADAPGLNLAKLPETENRRIPVQVDQNGVRFEGSTEVVKFADAYKADLEELDKKIRDEVAKGDAKDSAKIDALQKQRDADAAIHQVLADPAHPDHAAETARAQTKFSEFQVKAAELRAAEAKAGEVKGTEGKDGRGGGGKTVALVTLLGLWLAAQPDKK